MQHRHQPVSNHVFAVVVASILMTLGNATAAESRYPLVQAFRAAESDKGYYQDTTSVSDYEVVHLTYQNATTSTDTTVDQGAELLAIEKARGDLVTTLMHSQNAGVAKNRNDEVYAGHWLYQEGAFALADFNDTATSIKITDPGDYFSANDEAMITCWNSSLTGDDKHEWDVSEAIVITTVDTEGITVTRSATPVNWGAQCSDKISIAPHAKFNDEDIRVINVSTTSPTDTNGLTGWEWFAKDYYDNVWSTDGVDGTSGTSVDGIIFDGGRWLFNATTSIPVDVNNDGDADYGIINGENVFGLGTLKYLEKLRSDYLPDKIILMDSSTVDMGFRAWDGPLNGMEDENFMAEGQEFSEAFTHLKQWVENVTQTPRLSYGFTKEDTKKYYCDPGRDTNSLSNARFRVAFAASLMLGTSHPYAAETDKADSTMDTTGDGTADAQRCFDAYEWDEYKGGAINDRDWLGAALTDATQNLDDLGTSNIIGANAKWDYKTVTTTSGYTASDNATTTDGVVSHTLTVSAVPTTTESGSVFYPSVGGTYLRVYENTATKETDIDTTQTDTEFTLSFTAQATTANAGVPRLVQVQLVPTKVYKGTAATGVTSKSQLILVPTTATDYRLSFTLDETDGISKVQIFSGEETGKLSISNLDLRTGSANRWIRYFDGGAALINMTGSAWNAQLGTDHGSAGYARLTGDIDPEINTGAEGDGASKDTFTVPAGDALVVAAIPVTDSDGDGVMDSDDCAPTDKAIYPGNAETCNKSDDDCDGSIDEGLPRFTYYRDLDKDGYGKMSLSTVSGVIKTCATTPPLGYARTSTDCNDMNAKINPGAAEIPGNKIDENCDGVVK